MPEALDLSKMEPIFEKFRGQEGALIPALQEAQNIYGYLSEEVLAHVSRELKMPLSRIYGVVTFYAQFYLTPRGRHTVRVCRGTACHVRGGRASVSPFSNSWASKRMRPRRITSSPLRPWLVWGPVPCPRCSSWTRRITES